MSITMRRIFWVLVLVLPMLLDSVAADARPYDGARVTERQHKLNVISKSRAIAAVRAEIKGKILSAHLIPSQGPPVYRVKVLLAKGRIRTVFVDGETADVIRIR